MKTLPLPFLNLFTLDGDDTLHDEIHRGLKSQTPADVHLLNRRTSAGELCRIVKLLTCLLGEGDKFSNQFDSYPSTRIR